MSELLTANDLACKTSGEVKTWFENVSSGNIKTHAEFNWLGLAFATGSNARDFARKSEKSLSFEWAEISLKIYENLSETSDKNVSHSNEMSAMMLRAFMINYFGELKGNYVLDSQIITDWFYCNLDLSLEEALEESNQWRKFNHEKRISRLKTEPSKMIKIMRIKNRLTIIELLQNSGNINLDNDLKMWLTSRKHFA